MVRKVFVVAADSSKDTSSPYGRFIQNFQTSGAAEVFDLRKVHERKNLKGNNYPDKLKKQLEMANTVIFVCTQELKDFLDKKKDSLQNHRDYDTPATKWRDPILQVCSQKSKTLLLLSFGQVHVPSALWHVQDPNLTGIISENFNPDENSSMNKLIANIK